MDVNKFEAELISHNLLTLRGYECVFMVTYGQQQLVSIFTFVV